MDAFLAGGGDDAAADDDPLSAAAEVTDATALAEAILPPPLARRAAAAAAYGLTPFTFAARALALSCIAFISSSRCFASSISRWNSERSPVATVDDRMGAVTTGPAPAPPTDANEVVEAVAAELLFEAPRDVDLWA
jgi:hypothetical protein